MAASTDFGTSLTSVEILALSSHRSVQTQPRALPCVSLDLTVESGGIVSLPHTTLVRSRDNRARLAARAQ